ncbi:MAG: LysR family transcriptional regulator [Rhizobiaceae bacterium]|nr:LysR family transcriptional regulator [Rhizobiaceae bacterium]
MFLLGFMKFATEVVPMHRNLPPLSTLRAFEATARLGSVGAAADEIGRTHGAVSRQLAALQEHAGVALFEKKGTGIQLTKEGKAFHSTVDEALRTLGQGYRRIREDARGPSVQVTCSATFAMYWLVPRLARFYRKHADIKVHLLTASSLDGRNDEADVVLTWDRLAYPDIDQQDTIYLANLSFAPVCIPSYAFTLEEGRFIAATRITRERGARAWSNWQSLSGIEMVTDDDLVLQHTYLCKEAALNGLGVALMERRFIENELARGEVIAPCGWTISEHGLVAMLVSDRAGSNPVRFFLAWMRKELSQALPTIWGALRLANVAPLVLKRRFRKMPAARRDFIATDEHHRGVRLTRRKSPRRQPARASIRAPGQLWWRSIPRCAQVGRDRARRGSLGTGYRSRAASIVRPPADRRPRRETHRRHGIE